MAVCTNLPPSSRGTQSHRSNRESLSAASPTDGFAAQPTTADVIPDIAGHIETRLRALFKQLSDDPDLWGAGEAPGADTFRRREAQ
ncbi:hypothetical protein HRR83_008156 [Exophiala dermatitidis]|uniref:Uncharacterized protein n=1 Tax=Exophiala dermatitidis TaxID=5970 RepID=A0AAN6ITN7_EXODE|nr:hypothetical protein HRR74_007890 [Exophiala dermatitidis]KAJ4513586.1 hypothetical protein HRR73_005744 [Exophiala dermatitidis]KAJ4535571.1 hypothetical protein HRR77_007890 [Exophiala dermatitidis]KAJ4544495.1 hypothetical protein HRR76_002554 [Exophiala dermatitidis]KAJ4561441.1 hypothetical protein HRR79_007271 [Exophiala dermatitidis]